MEAESCARALLAAACLPPHWRRGSSRHNRQAFYALLKPRKSGRPRRRWIAIGAPWYTVFIAGAPTRCICTFDQPISRPLLHRRPRSNTPLQSFNWPTTGFSEIPQVWRPRALRESRIFSVKQEGKESNRARPLVDIQLTTRIFSCGLSLHRREPKTFDSPELLPCPQRLFSAKPTAGGPPYFAGVEDRRPRSASALVCVARAIFNADAL